MADLGRAVVTVSYILGYIVAAVSNFDCCYKELA